jgi:hypothetical protein
LNIAKAQVFETPNPDVFHSQAPSSPSSIMAGEKRPFAATAASSSSASPFMPMFEKFRDNLDEHHDRRERIIKASRDITALSKKM